MVGVKWIKRVWAKPLLLFFHFKHMDAMWQFDDKQ